MRVVLVGLLMAALAGCTSSSVFDPSQQFQAADQRWADQMTVAADVDYRGSALEGPSVWRVSAESPDGFNMKVYGRSGLLDGNLGFGNAESNVRGLHWASFQPQYTGEIRVEVACGGPCGYTVARDQNGTLPTVPGLEHRYRSADARFADSLEDSFGSHDFEVPEGVETVRMRASAYSPEDWFRLAVTDSDGDSYRFLRFPAVSMNDLDLANLVDPDDEGVPAGTWNLLVTCDGVCDYNFGFYW